MLISGCFCFFLCLLLLLCLNLLCYTAALVVKKYVRRSVEMSFKLGLAECAYPIYGTISDQVEEFAAAAQNAGVSILAFPEYLMCPEHLGPEQLENLAEPLNGPFVKAAALSAKHHNLWIVLSMAEASLQGKKPFNSVVILDPSGAVAGIYHKCHLYDAHAVRESDTWEAGSKLCSPIKTPFCTLGVAICYDLRFPEVARELALAGCDLVLYPAAWFKGPHKELHWETLLRARAIENECYVAGICRAGNSYVTKSMACDPLGETLALEDYSFNSSGASRLLGMSQITPSPLTQGETLALEEHPLSSFETSRLLVCDINPESVDSVRSAMPVFGHRHPELYSLR